MSIAEASAVSVWSWSQFWIGVPIVLMICIFGLVSVIAVVRARPEDVPRVLTIIGSAFSRLAERFRTQHDATGLAGPGAEIAPAEESRHDSAICKRSGGCL